MFTIYGGKTEFNQWDLEQLVTCDCLMEGDEVVFSGHGKTYETTAFVQDGKVWADVPNFMLNKAGNFVVDLGWGLHRHMDCRTVFNVAAKAKPEDYVCPYNIKPRNTAANGGVSAPSDWNASEGEAGYVRNRTHYEEVEVLSEAVNITWDGNTEGLLSDGGFFYKVSDLILTDAQIKASTINNSEGQTIVVGDMWDAVVSAGYITPEAAFLEAAVIVRTPNADFLGMKFPECGVYFMQTPVQAGGAYATALTAPEQVTTTVKPLDEKYLPDTVATKADIFGAMEASY